MADWVDCELTVLGDKESLDTFEKKAKGFGAQYLGVEPDEEVLSFHQLYPVPKALTETYYSEKSYAWERVHWGCNRGAKNSKILNKADESCLYSFRVNGVPDRWLVVVSKDFPDLIFHLDCQSETDLSVYKVAVENGILFNQGAI